MTQYTSRAVIQTVGGTTIGHLKDVRYGFRPRPIVEHDIDGGDPDLHEPGELEYFISAAWGYVSDVIRAAVKNTKVAIVVGLRGTGSGMPRHTLTDALISFEIAAERNRVVMVNITGSYRTETIDTYP